MNDVQHIGKHADEVAATWMIRNAVYVPPRTTLLDVACGKGRHTRYFALRGAYVTAVDRDGSGLQALATLPNVSTEQRDLENYPWPYAEHSFDTVLVCNYLWRPAASALVATVKPGGLLLYETFMIGQERFGKPTRPEFLLRPNELLQWTQGTFRVIAFQQQHEIGPDGKPFAMKQKIAAVKLHGPIKSPDESTDSAQATTAGADREPTSP